MRNAASEFIELHVPGIGSRYTLEEMAAGLPDDFVRQDLRRLVDVPTTDAQGFVDGMRAYFELGYGPPTFRVERVVAVRGERLALTLTRAEYPGGHTIEILSACQLTADLRRLELNVDFDTEDEAGAIEELDRMHRALGEDRRHGN